MDFDQKVEQLWNNPHGVKLHAPLLYRIDITCEESTQYSYIGNGRDDSPLKAYQRNLRNIENGRERGQAQNYRAVHLALYRALKRGWDYDCYLLENAEKADIAERKRTIIEEHSPNLNGAATWRVADMAELTIDRLIGSR